MKNLFICSSLLLLLLFTSCDNNDSENNEVSELNLVTSINTSGKLTYTNLLAVSPVVSSFTVASLDAEGVSYDNEADAVTIVSRTNNKLETYSGVKTELTAGVNSLTVTLSSAATDFSNPRETAVSGDKVVVV